jgi:phosphoheptose isomerase
MQDRNRGLANMPSVLAQNIEQSIAMSKSLATFERQVETASRVIADTLKSGHKLLVCGNGGSAADAAHLTTEFVCRFNRDRRPYPALCLAVHGGDLTGIGNDYKYEEVFSRQVEAFAQTGDVLIAFTTSGNSPNVLKALQVAKKLNIKAIAFLGREGGRCAGLATIDLIVPNDVTARIQEGHKLLLHTICEMVEQQLPS